MRVLIAQSQFLLGGTESYAVTVAEQLERLGHPTRIHAATASDVGRELVTSRGLRLTVGAPLGLGEADEVDAVIAQDAATAYALAARLPDVPQVFVTHGFAPIERPATGLAPIPTCVVLNDRVGSRAAALEGRPPLVRLRQPIDVERFRPVEGARPTARRVLLLSNFLPEDRLRMLAGVCAELGLELTRVGDGAGATIDPRPELVAADIVVGYGRSALEGMAMGRSTYVWERAGGDGWVTPENYAALEADGFSGGATDAVIDRERLRADLAAYRPELGALSFDLVRNNHSAARHAIALVELLDRASAPSPSDQHETISLIARAEARAAARAGSFENQFRQLVRAHGVERDRAEAAEAKLAELLGSSSWRLTAPLRRLGTRLRRR